MLEWSLSVSMISNPRRTGMDRVVARRDGASCLEVKTGRKFCRLETDNEVETGKVFRPMCLTARKDLGCGKVLEVLVIGDNIDRESRALKVMLPMFEGFKDCEEFFVVN